MEETIDKEVRARVAQRFSIDFDYPVVFTRGVFDPANGTLIEAVGRRLGERPHQVMVFVDSGVAEAFSDVVSRIESYFQSSAGVAELRVPPLLVPGGESAKADFRLVEEWIRQAFDHAMCRHSYFVAVGGGAVLDAVGFAAALIHRGVRLIRVPTTVLAQNDAGVGVKNGINWGLGKNALGTFAPPHAVINDLCFLSGLPDAHWIGGVAEAFKVALLKDADFFEFLCRNADELRLRNEEAMEEVVVRCAELHLEHIRTSGDPFEAGEARPLDFGHWSAHCLEWLSEYRVPHGQAVAMGLAIDCAYAREMGWLSPDDFERVYDGLRRCGFPLWYLEIEYVNTAGERAIYSGFEQFREHLGGRLTLTFPDGIGVRREEHEVNLELCEKVFRELRDRAEGAR